MIIAEEVLHAFHCLLKLYEVRQVDDAEVVRLAPVEAGAARYEYLLFF